MTCVLFGNQMYRHASAGADQQVQLPAPTRGMNTIGAATISTTNNNSKRNRAYTEDIIFTVMLSQSKDDANHTLVSGADGFCDQSSALLRAIPQPLSPQPVVMLSTATSKKRATPNTDGDEDNKRLCSAIEDSLEELVCSITYELPLEPVTAEDGKIYERAAIEDWLKNHDKSPCTNVSMGKKLMPALQVKNMIEKLVQSGAIKGDKADAWKTKIKDQEEVAAYCRRAEDGDALAIRVVSGCYVSGKRGFPKDLAKTYYWSKRGADAGDPASMMLLADAHVRCWGGAVKNLGMAVHWMTVAAAECKYSSAAAVLGFAFAPANTRQGLYYNSLARTGAHLALPENVQRATMWFRKALEFGKGLLLTTRKENLQDVRTWLQRHAVD